VVVPAIVREIATHGSGGGDGRGNRAEAGAPPRQAVVVVVTEEVYHGAQIKCMLGAISQENRSICQDRLGTKH
jgi:hypothetical protein